MAERTFFLALDRGLVVRNILRTGVLERLLDGGNRVVLLLPRRPEGIPAYLREEFSHPGVHLEEVPERSDSFVLTRLWLPFINNLVYTEFTDTLAREGSGKVKPVPRWWYPFHRRIFGWLSRRPSLKRLARWMDFHFFRAQGFGELFRKYRPDAVFVGSIISKYDIAVLKAAKAHGVPTVGMQKGWDNLQKQLIRHIPDRFLIQNSRMEGPAKAIQAISPDVLRVVGFPQFDNYVRREGLPTREAFFAARGLSPETKVIFFGSEGLWTPLDDQRFEELVAWQRDGVFPFPTYLIARPHFSDIRKGRFARFKGLPGVFVDDGYRHGTYFSDTWDPSRADMRHFEAELLHADVLVSYASTLSLDAACFDLPIVSVCYGSMVTPDGRDITMNLYKADHYLPVVESGAAELVMSSEAMRDAIVAAVRDRSVHADGRKRLRESMCGSLDGQSAARVAAQILAAPSLRV